MAEFIVPLFYTVLNYCLIIKLLFTFRFEYLMFKITNIKFKTYLCYGTVPFTTYVEYTLAYKVGLVFARILQSRNIYHLLQVQHYANE